MDQNRVPMMGETSPFHWLNGQGLSLRLQVFLTVRDEERRVATVRLRDPSGYWWLPAETLRPNEPVNDAAERVAQSWFGRSLDASIKDIITFQDEGEGKWYILFVFEAQAPPEGLPVLDDTEEIQFVPVGKAPGPFAMGHADVLPLLPE